MKGFTPDQVKALLDLRGIWPEEKFVVVGANAIACHIDFRWRQTLDIDLTIARGMEDCQRELRGLHGWAPDRRSGQAWTAPGGVRVDVIPVSPLALEKGTIEWPDGSVMSSVGLRAAFADARRVQIDEDTCVQVASPAALVVLKMAASLDRPDRERDLADLAHLMEDVAVDEEERWSEAIIDLDLEYETVGPYLLGRRVGSLANDEERRVVDRFLSRLEDRNDATASLSGMQRLGPISWQQEGIARARVAAFRQGFDSTNPGG